MLIEDFGPQESAHRSEQEAKDSAFRTILAMGDKDFVDSKTVLDTTVNFVVNVSKGDATAEENWIAFMNTEALKADAHDAVLRKLNLAQLMSEIVATQRAKRSGSQLRAGPQFKQLLFDAVEAMDVEGTVAALQGHKDSWAPLKATSAEDWVKRQFQRHLQRDASSFHSVDASKGITDFWRSVMVGAHTGKPVPWVNVSSAASPIPNSGPNKKTAMDTLGKHLRENSPIVQEGAARAIANARKKKKKNPTPADSIELEVERKREWKKNRLSKETKTLGVAELRKRLTACGVDIKGKSKKQLQLGYDGLDSVKKFAACKSKVRSNKPRSSRTRRRRRLRLQHTTRSSRRLQRSMAGISLANLATTVLRQTRQRSKFRRRKNSKKNLQLKRSLQLERRLQLKRRSHLAMSRSRQRRAT